MRTVTFTLEVEVSDDSLKDDPLVSEIEREAREILYSAPAFDGISEDIIADLELHTIEKS